MEKQEIWRPVVGYENFYEVSNCGRVKSLPRKGTKGGILKPSPDGDGYLHVDLSKNGEKNMRKVHILIMRAFVGRCPDGCEVDHIDWNPENNMLDNLRYIPKKENSGRHSEEWRNAVMKRSQNQEWRKNHSEGCRKRSQNQEWRKNQAEAMKKLHQDPEWQRKNAEANRRKAQDPEWRKKNAEVARKKYKPVNQYTLEGEYIKTWESVSEAARELGFSQGNISECCRGKRKTAGGFIWKFAVCST